MLAVARPEYGFASALALARAHPTFIATSKSVRREVSAIVLLPDGACAEAAPLQVAADAVRRAADLVDQPPNQLTTTSFVAHAQALAGRVDAIEITVYQGRELDRLGFGGLWGVGKAATAPPALVVLDHAPEDPVRRTCWVGKGITYDTGGLSLKTKTGMPGMKNDMGGAAAVLAAFEAAVALGSRERLTAVLCIAENAIGPDAMRPDDVLRMYSGRTVEVNNTDAEGRLVLADGVAWAVRQRRPDRLIDVATLTGAQAMATGKRAAAVVASTEGIEREAVRAGLASGELCHPLPFVPEFYRREFGSSIADMRNSVKDRSNAQASCAAQFIANHLGGYDREWLHVDMAGPVMQGGRGTGFGVGLLLTLAGVGA
ncbi:MAG: putative aminopeptidase NPEPL1 [Myxococcota bacterium]